MKKIVLIASLCMLAGFSFAQKKAVKQAKSAIAKTAEARELIKPTLTYPESAQDPETWKVAGDIEYKSFDVEYEAEMTKGMPGGRAGNEEIMYTGIYNMVDYYKKADELGELPDEKGKIKNKVRKDIINNFRVAHHFYINGGVYYNDLGIQANRNNDEAAAKKNYGKAADFFEMYWDVPELTMFQGEKEPLVTKDSTFQTIKYYAAISAVQSGDTKRSIALLNKLIESPYIETKEHTVSDPYELLASEYLKMEDSVNYVKTLELGAEKFPRNQFFTPNLINAYIRAEQADKALAYLDQAIKNDPESKCDLLSVKASLLSSEKKYEESKSNYQAAIDFDNNCERALEGLGVLYMIEAQDLKETVMQETNKQKLKEIDDKTISLYNLAVPNLESYVKLLKARSAEDSEMRIGLQRLYTAYYSLSLLNVHNNERFEEVEKELEKYISSDDEF